MENKLKIAIVDDHEMFRSGLKLILAQKKQWQVVLEAVSGDDFLDQLSFIVPDIVLLDISMPGLNGYDTAIKALAKHPNLKIIVLTMLNEEQYYVRMLEAGVKAFILKKSGAEELFKAIDEVWQGNSYFAQDLLKNIGLILNSKKVDDHLNLNENEKKVLSYICIGLTNKEISDKIFLSIKSVEKYRTSLLQKTGTKNAAHLVLFAIKNQLIDLSDSE